MGTKKVLIWGTGTDYDKYVNNFFIEEKMGNIEILALVSKEKQFSYLDNKMVIDSSQIIEYNFDYIIITSERRYKDIVQEAVSLGIDSKKLINVRVFSLPKFDFMKYTNILESNISIISNDCWGGLVYHTLDIQNKSPFINTFIEDEDYITLLGNLEHYMKQPLVMERDGEFDQFPIASLGEKVKLKLWHYESFTMAKECWDRRIKRFNFDNFFIKMTIKDDEMAEKFDNLPFENKVGFYYKQTKYDSIVCLNEFQSAYFGTKYNYNFSQYVRNVVEINSFTAKSYDIFKLLCGEKDFIRKV